MFSRFLLRLVSKKMVRILLILLLLAVLIAGAGIAFIEIGRHQAIVLPAPTGSYAVGRMEYDWTDQSRTDPLAPHAGTKRELVVWAWYPVSHVPGAQSAAYLPPKWGQANDNPLMQSNDSIQTHSIANAPLTTSLARYPVLIFEPGMGKLPTQYTSLLEDLASHGYIIFAITPTYSADTVVFSNGQVAEATPAGKIEDDANLQAAGNRLVPIWSQDVIFTINQLDRLNATPGGMWSQHLDLARLGVFGHSFGGATAAQVCHVDARCKAGLDIDGDLFGSVVQTGLDKPFMVIQLGTDPCSDANCRSFQQGVQAVLHTVPRGESYHIGIKDAKHFNCSDYAVYFSPMRIVGALGSIDGARGLQITRAYVRAFFDTSLNKTPSPLLQGEVHSYPEVQFFTP